MSFTHVYQQKLHLGKQYEQNVTDLAEASHFQTDKNILKGFENRQSKSLSHMNAKNKTYMCILYKLNTRFEAL